MANLPPRSLTSHLLSGGFRLFFLAGALQAALMIALWVPWFLGFMHVPTALPPLAWHQHELLFGFVPAVIAGFLLTAVPNWTGRKGLTGLPLLFLFLLWLAGRLAISLSEEIGPAVATVASVAFLPVLALLVLRELVAAKNRRNYKIVAVLGVLTAAQVAFHYELQRFGSADIADRLAIGAIILLIAIVGGRIIPAFTGNWLKATKPGRLPIAFDRFDLATMIISGGALLLWPVAARMPQVAALCGVAMLAAGVLQLARQLRWCPERTLREPLVTILHVAFLFVPLGFLLTGASLLIEDPGMRSAGIHAWTSGAIGTMTLAVMTRATRGHAGQALRAPRSTVLVIYVPVVTAALARVVAAMMPAQTMILLPLAGLLWIVAFLGFAILYAPMILRKG